MTDMFLKYPSLTNHYAISPKSYAIVNNLDEQWYATEKVDGSNISVNIDLNSGEWEFAKRSKVIDKDEPKPFNAIWKIISESDIEDMRLKLIELGFTGIAHIYGELYGAGIQGQDYTISKEGVKDVVLYDILVEENEEITQANLSELQYVVPIKFSEPVISENTLKELLKQKPSDVSYFGGANEGYVYKLVNGFKKYQEGNTYPVIKHKTDAYLENKGVPKKSLKPKMKLSPEQESMIPYITETRVSNIISHGDIELAMTSMGLLIKEMSRDIASEWVRDNQEFSTTEEEALQLLKPLTTKIALASKKELRRQIAQNI